MDTPTPGGGSATLLLGATVGRADASLEPGGEEALGGDGTVRGGRQHRGLQVGDDVVVEVAGLGDDAQRAVEADTTAAKSLAKHSMTPEPGGELEAPTDLSGTDTGGPADLVRGHLVGTEWNGRARRGALEVLLLDGVEGRIRVDQPSLELRLLNLQPLDLRHHPLCRVAQRPWVVILGGLGGLGGLGAPGPRLRLGPR
ncbi:hypothetical protein [Terrabacter sp. NPDC080008]|uniref:hypothetical protein n=1 Tax=Terrabacter sp. NPDC080008 TaxID=3155176 RepID=UPI00344B1C2A